jgi:putative hemolysin
LISIKNLIYICKPKAPKYIQGVFYEKRKELGIESEEQAIGKLANAKKILNTANQTALRGNANYILGLEREVSKFQEIVTGYNEISEALDKINKSGYSRIPVFQETIDKIDGILYIKDLLPHIDEDETFKWQNLIRSAYFVPETKKIDSLLRDFQEKRVHIAVVVDEYGGTSGLITLEDIIEEIVGEINDEFDDEIVSHSKMDKNTYVFEGKTSLNDFCKVVGVDISKFDDIKGESESLGGLILEINSTLPSVDEKIVYGKYVFTIMAVDNKRIKKIKVQINE